MLEPRVLTAWDRSPLDDLDWPGSLAAQDGRCPEGLWALVHYRGADTRHRALEAWERGEELLFEEPDVYTASLAGYPARCNRGSMTPVTLTVQDETTSGQVLQALELQLAAERLSVRDLIAARVHQEVGEHNARRVLTPFKGLVQPTDEEARLNGRRGPRRVDPQAQTKVALRAFERGNVLLLVDDRQVDDLDEEVVLRPDSTVSFLKLVPLVGG